MDTLPDLRWTSASSETLADFLSQRKPSMIRDDGTKPWIWIEKDGWEGTSTNTSDNVDIGQDIVSEVTERVEKIEADPNIPTRGSKVKGTRSKKDLREEAQAEAAAKLKELSLTSGYTVGKWLLFRDGSKVDGTFATLAKSLINGSLSKTAAGCLKVATCPKFDEEHYQHVFCIYYPNVYSRDSSREILQVVAEQHGIELSSVKSDLYTVLNLDSKHPSKMRSTIWQPKELGLDKPQLKALTDTYWAAHASPLDDTPTNGSDGVASKRKQPPALSKEETKAKAKKTKTALAKKTFADDSHSSSSDDDSSSKKKSTTKEKKTSAPRPKPWSAAEKVKGDVDSSEEEKLKAREIRKSKPVATKVDLSGSETEEE